MFTQELADAHSAPGGLFGHVQAPGHAGVNLRRRVLRGDVLAQLGRSLVDGLASGLSPFQKAFTQPRGAYGRG